jgi:mannose-6-phosphate isomerase-like protein (cupin superfamily)
MPLSFSSQVAKNIVFNNVEAYLLNNGFKINNKDEKRPWGGFFVIDEIQSRIFFEKFFSSYNPDDFINDKKISPKILIVAPNKRLSWQYHFRRAELWKVIGGKAGIVTSDTDEENEMGEYSINSVITLKKGERHRLIGLDAWGIIAEIWQHTDENNPSDENDIVRVQDDFGR